MTEKLLEQVSALADDELNAREAELLLTRMQREDGLRDAWERYHLVGEAMRGALAARHDRDFAGGVAAAIDREEALRDRKPAFGRWLRPVAGVAVAASVAMLAVFTLQLPQQQAPSEIVPSAGNAPLSRPLVRVQPAEFSGVRSAEVQNQLRSYLLNHSEHAGGSRIRGVMPYVQLAAYDTRANRNVDEPAADDDENRPETRD